MEKMREKSVTLYVSQGVWDVCSPIQLSLYLHIAIYDTDVEGDSEEQIMMISEKIVWAKFSIVITSWNLPKSEQVIEPFDTYHLGLSPYVYPTWNTPFWNTCVIRLYLWAGWNILSMQDQKALINSWKMLKSRLIPGMFETYTLWLRHTSNPHIAIHDTDDEGDSKVNSDVFRNLWLTNERCSSLNQNIRQKSLKLIKSDSVVLHAHTSPQRGGASRS